MKIKFTKQTLPFLVTASKQKNPHWLDKNKQKYEAVLKKPFIALAETVKKNLKPLAPEYHFPSKGLARIKRPDFKVQSGLPQYKDWVSMIATRPSESRFESNPHLFFGLFPNEKQKIIIAGGLWQPSSKQTRLIREAIYKNAYPFLELFEEKNFKKRFPNSFCMDKQSTRVPTGFNSDHEFVNWIKLKNFVVLKEINIKDFCSDQFPESVVKDFKEALKLNCLLEKALRSDWPD